jgi:naphthalene 1,2-dioxygenase ferredoxin component
MAAAGVARWRAVARLIDVSDGEPYLVTVDDAAIALYRVAGTVYAVSDICTHEYVRLSGGALDGASITCPLHHARFDVTTGRCLARPADRDLATFPVRVDGDTVLIKL